jgi:DNA-binding XRE family transcriptional regulator
MDIPTYTTTSGVALAEARMAAGVKAAELARIIGITRQSLFAWERLERLDHRRTQRYLSALRQAMGEAETA